MRASVNPSSPASRGRHGGPGCRHVGANQRGWGWPARSLVYRLLSGSHGFGVISASTPIALFVWAVTRALAKLHSLS